MPNPIDKVRPVTYHCGNFFVFDELLAHYRSNCESLSWNTEADMHTQQYLLTELYPTNS